MQKLNNIWYAIAFSCGTVCNYLEISQEAIFILTILMLVDTFTGIIKTIALKKKPTSSRLSLGILSKVTLMLIPFCLALAGKGIGLELITVALGTINVLILSETYSIISNIYVIRTRKDVKEYDVISLLLNKLRKILEKLMVDKS